MVSTKRASELYFKVAMGEKLLPSEAMELYEYDSKFNIKNKDCLLDDL